jgi:STE24 endopeptidase
MPIIIVLLLTASCARVPWPKPPFGFGGSGSLALTTFAFLIPYGASLVLARWVTSTLLIAPSRRSEVAREYAKYRRLLSYANLGVALFAVVGLGWGWTVWNRFVLPGETGPQLLPFGELLVPAPYIFSIWMAWLVHFDAERAFHQTRESAEPFWSRSGHFLYNLRPFAFLILLPVLLFAGQQTFSRFAPKLAESFVARVVSFSLVPILFVGLPILIRPVLGLQPMPAGPTRDRLEELARKFRFRFSNILVWHTRGSMANALVVGVVPWARYIVFTDRLLETLSPDEQDAVFGHEVGHVKHWHIPYYALFFLLSAVAVAVVVSLALAGLATAQWIDEKTWEPWAGLPTLGFLMAYLFLVFGFLSRRCERQADLYGCRAETGERITPAGTEAMIRALERVADLNGLDATHPQERQSLRQRLWSLFQAWQHGSITERIHFLRTVQDQPELEPREQRRIFLLRSVLLVVLASIVAALSAVVGWQEIAKLL